MSWEIALLAKHSYSRHIEFESVLNFRDLGGYRTRAGRMVAWRRLFRSGELHHMTKHDITRLREELGLRSVIDLRNDEQLELHGVGPLDEVGIKYFNIPFILDIDKDKEREVLRESSNAGEVSLYYIKHKDYGKRIIEALEIIAEPDNHPLVFHCNAGKDRSGILAAIVLGILDVADEDIIRDYTLTTPYMKDYIERWDNDPEAAEVHRSLPGYLFKALPASMALILSSLRQEYGSIREYMEAQRTSVLLFNRLERALLV